MAKGLTKEQRETLSRYENHLHTAFYADYVVGLPARDVRVLYGVFNEINSAHETNYSCNFCKMRVMKALGRLYFGEVKKGGRKAPSSTKVTDSKKKAK